MSLVTPIEPARIGEGRTLPNDLLSEQSTIGGMLLSQEAIAEVFEFVKADDLDRKSVV